MTMHIKITVLTALLALWNIAFTISAPLPIAREKDFQFEQALAYDAGAQVPLSAPSPFTVPPSKTEQSPTSVSTAPTSSVSPYPTHFVLPAWVTGPYPLSLVPEDRGVFDSTIEGITLAKKHSSLGNNNAGIYNVESYDSSFSELFPSNVAPDIDASRLLVKVLKAVDDNMIAEVKALKIVGQFVASGMMKVEVGEVRKNAKNRVKDESMFEVKPVIVMLKMPGQALTSTPGFIAAKDIETKRQMMGDTLTMMCDRVGQLALEHRFVHRDNIIPNIMVIAEGTKIIDINIIDWGGKFLSSIEDDVTYDDLMVWCHRRWAIPVWERSI
jgi:hypothetical protein